MLLLKQHYIPVYIGLVLQISVFTFELEVEQEVFNKHESVHCALGKKRTAGKRSHFSIKCKCFSQHQASLVT